MQKYITNIDRLLKQLIILAVLANAVGLIFPLTSISFGPWYGSIAKYIALNNNWSDLYLSNHDWLDKPHFPFWITAASFKIFGINSFAYMIPGFLFHLIGAVYTYKLTNYLYNNKTTSLLATLIYLTVFHLMMSSIDVRAEAYLLGQIIPATYYWLQYDRKFTWQALLLGSFFTGLGLMTKGIFVIITIVSGVFALWIYEKRLINVISPKWWLALTLSFVFATPEVVALYLQFDLHPEKIIFGHTHVSGVRWFFIDSQFGRFFGSGYIHSTNPPPLHQLFFVHTFLWSFLPWTFVYPYAVYSSIRNFKIQSTENKRNIVFLLGSFWISFVMFSVTTFQVDHYTNIIFPFAAILCAGILTPLLNKNHPIFKLQQKLSIFILVIVAIIVGAAFKGLPLVLLVSFEIVLLLSLVKNWGQMPSIKAIMLSVSAICLVIVVFEVLGGVIYHRYDAAYYAAQTTSKNPQIPVVDYKYDSRTLEFYVHNKYNLAQQIQDIPNYSEFYVVTDSKNSAEIYQAYPQAQLITTLHGNTPENVLPNIVSADKLQAHLESFSVIYVRK